MTALADWSSGTGTSVMQLSTELAFGSSSRAHARALACIGVCDAGRAGRATTDRTLSDTPPTSSAAVNHWTARRPLPTRLTSLVCRRGDLPEGLTDDSLDLIRRRGYGHVVDVDRERKPLALSRGDVAGEPFPGHQQPTIERVVHRERAGLREHMPRRARFWLDIPQRSVSTENGQCAEERRAVGPFGHRREKAHHERRREMRVAAGAVPLLRARDVEPERREEFALEVEPGGGRVPAAQRAEDIRHHAGVKVLADLERHLHLLA